MRLIKIIIPLIFFSLVQVSHANTYLIKPTGRYGVSFQDIPLINSTLCPDSFYQHKINEKEFETNNKKYCHEMMLRVYYPVAEIPKKYDTYYTPYLKNQNNWFVKKYDLKSQDVIQLNSIMKVKAYVKANINIVADGEFPIVIFSPGSGSSAQVYTNLISNMVSHGYIVIGVNSMFINGPIQKANGFIVQSPDSYQATVGRQENLSDIKFTLDNLNKIPFKYSLKKHMNFNSIGLMGHSRGGMSIVQLLNQKPANKKIKAILLMDPANDLGAKNYPLSMPNIPTLVMWSASFQKDIQGSILLKKNIHNLILQDNQGKSDYSNHNNFSDFSTLQYHPAYSNSNVHNELTVGTGNGYEIAKIVNNQAVAFFNTYLQNQ